MDNVKKRGNNDCRLWLGGTEATYIVEGGKFSLLKYLYPLKNCTSRLSPMHLTLFSC